MSHSARASSTPTKSTASAARVSPNGVWLETKNGECLISEFIQGQPHYALRKEDPKGHLVSHAVDRLRCHFPVDTLLGAWDVIDLRGNNIMVDEHGRAWRIDKGCMFQWRARGEKKIAERWSNAAPAQREQGCCENLRQPHRPRNRRSGSRLFAAPVCHRGSGIRQPAASIGSAASLYKTALRRKALSCPKLAALAEQPERGCVESTTKVGDHMCFDRSKKTYPWRPYRAPL